ncbi:hypothetical protein ACGP04_02245 [Piscirickettsia salmonis]|uniref:hypothetical protein n=1 Tax=Piscirickettsia salmonis TaxID=1238 RepID=UPI0037501844
MKKIDPQLDIRVWPDDNNKAEVEFVLTWDHPPGILREYPNLKCISSTAAGVDHILNDKELPKNIPITRVIAPNLPQSMYEYVLTAVMYYFRNFDSYQAQKIINNGSDCLL